ncbi:MAG: DUF456 domain-containing protein [Deltaproteobacteria bacterium]|nr:DUF456 domain-containing protein [Deltaproteobacteria bacterium]MBM4317796.1 DUF456 domain-containing protein [Deltaproteobacteria bacterium]
MWAIIAWTVLVLFLLVGVVGIVLPAMPGMVLIFAGVLIHKLLLPFYLSWWTLGVVSFGVLATFGLDFLGSTVGAKWGGASKQGMIGLLLGGLVGIFFAPAGLILGPLIGVFVGEVFVASRPVVDGAKAGIGATLGVAVSTLLKLLLGLILVAWVICDLIFF